MASQPKAAPDVIRSRDASDKTPLDRRTMTSTSSSNVRYSFGSSETGESSTASHKDASSFVEHTGGVVDDDGGKNGKLEKQQVAAVKSGKGSHRSHRSRSSGGFLLSKSAFEPPSSNVPEPEHIPRQRAPAHDRKGKAAIRNTNPEKRHTKTLSNLGTRVRSSPLAGNVTNASPGQEKSLDITKHDGAEGDNNGEEKPTAPSLDVDSAQIVNLALNLNESRRIAARRNISTPMPPITQDFAEGFAGGSLRHHLQQQRRSSRNISPKPERGERGTASLPRIPSGHRSNSPLQPAFESQSDGIYQYHFSQSTLARAEKAKNAIELMAQYRRLLQYVPPLKPQPHVERTTTEESGNDPTSPTSAPTSRATSATFPTPRPLGRPYNPLQYIRNRKVRLRTSKTINEEAEGFGDVDKVTSWVDGISTESSLQEFQSSDCLFLPILSKPSEEATSPHASPKSSISKNQRVKRPRNDWITDPTDMLADVFWLEQEDHKKLIEDNHGRRIFPQKVELKRPMSRRSDDPTPQHTPSPAHNKLESPETDLRIDTKLPDFKSVKTETEKHSDSATSKAKQKLRHVRDAARGHHGYHSPAEHGGHKIRSRSRSDSSSESDRRPHKSSRKRRSGTTDSHDRHGADILEKQMMEMLARESKESDWNLSNDDNQRTRYSSDFPKPVAVARSESTKNGSAVNSRSGSVINKERNGGPTRYYSSGRASLEVSGVNPRRSMDELDNTAPNSPQTRASRASLAFIPSIAMDLSPPASRSTSPLRTPLSKPRHKITPFRDQSTDRSRQRLPFEEDSPLSAHLKELAPESPSTAERRRRSMSPVKLLTGRKTDETVKHPLKKNGSLRKAKGEDSGIKGLFKSSRNPVTRVSDFIWKSAKEQLPSFNSGFSTDESEAEDIKTPQSKTQVSHSRASSVGISDEEMSELLAKRGEAPYSHDLPTFTSPFEDRGRPTKSRTDELKCKSEPQSTETIPSSTSTLKPPPRIDVHNASPTSSPDGPAIRRLRDSSPSDVDSRRQSLATGARLNEILGMPGQRRNALPMTGLANLEVSRQNRASAESRRHWSISDREVSVQRGPMTKVEIARVRALLLGSGIKAKEISRRAAELQDLRDVDSPHYSGIAQLAPDNETTNFVAPRSRQHILAAQLLSTDVQLSSRVFKSSADNFSQKIINDLLVNIESLQSRLTNNLTPMTRKTGDEADEVSKDLVMGQTLMVKRLGDKIDVMMRRRRRRFRWLRRGGWVLVEWGLVGVMWWVWFLVVLARVVLGVGRGVVGGVRWLFWL